MCIARAALSEKLHNFCHEIISHTRTQGITSAPHVSGFPEGNGDVRDNKKVGFEFTIVMPKSNCFFVRSWIIHNQYETVGKRAEEASRRSKHSFNKCYMVKKSRCYTSRLESREGPYYLCRGLCGGRGV